MKIAPQGLTNDKNTKQLLAVVSAAGGLGGPARSIGALLSQYSGELQRILICPSGSFSARALNHDWVDAHIPLVTSTRFHHIARILAAIQVAVWITKRRRDILAVHANGEAELNLVGLAVLLARVSLVVSARDTEVKPWLRRLGPLWRRLIPHTCWIAVSSMPKEFLLDARVASERQIHIVPNPVDLRDVVAEERVKSSYVRIGYLAGKYERKGYYLLPDIMEEMDIELVNWLIFTREPDVGAVSKERDTWNRILEAAPGRVRVKGRQADVAAAYAECDIVLSPSLRESFGRVPLEAMANGIPVVASDIPAYRSFIGDNECGVLFPPGDAAAAAKSLRVLVNDSELRETLGRVGVARAQAYDAQQIAERVRGLYENCEQTSAN